MKQPRANRDRQLESWHSPSGNGKGNNMTTYTFTTIDDPFGTNTFLYDINNAGQIVGTYTGGLTNGFLYSNGTFTVLNDPLGVSGTTAPSGINDLGQIVGL